MRFNEYTHPTMTRKELERGLLSTRARRAKENRRKYCSLYCYVVLYPVNLTIINMKKKRREFRALTMKILTG